MAFGQFLVLLISASLVRCATNGMVMDMDDSMTMTMANMTTYLHFTAGDNLWIYGWSTMNSRAMGAACVGMFMLALFERWLAANRGALEGYWARECVTYLSGIDLPSSSDTYLPLLHRARHLEKKGSLRAGIKLVPGARSHVPFAWSIDPVRGLIHTVQTGLGFTLMLVVMYVVPPFRCPHFG